MKTLYPLLFSLLFVFPAQAQKQKKQVFYHYKKLKSAEGYTLDDKKEGKWYYWSKEGYLDSTAEYQLDIYDGNFEKFEHPVREGYPDYNNPEDYKSCLKTQQMSTRNPRLKETGTYKNGLKNGNWKTYKDSILVQEQSYEGDRLNGASKNYYTSNGQLSEIITYHKGVKSGLYRKQGLNGLVEKEGMYYNDEKTGTWLEMEEGKKIVRQYKNNRLDGFSRMYDRDDSLAAEYHYKNGVLNGSYFTIMHNRRTKITGEYLDGLEHGTRKNYVDGKLDATCEMINGKRNGKFTAYNKKTGTVYETGYYKNDNKDSLWFFSFSGREYTHTFYRDNMVVYVTNFDEQGNKCKQMDYKPDEKAITTWWANNKKYKQSEPIDNGNIVTTWDANGKLLGRDTIPAKPPGIDIHEDKIVDEPERETIYTMVEEPATFPGGNEAMIRFFKDNMRYPDEKSKEYTGKIYLEIVVTKNGSVENVKVKRGLYPALDKEAVRVAQKMPKWEPGKTGGKVVSSFVYIPVTVK